MSDFTTEQLESLRNGTAPTSGSLKGTWSDAPRISRTQKVSAPSVIRSSHEGGEEVPISQVRGPSAQSVLAGQVKEESERRATAKAEADRLALLEDTTPDKVLARLCYLERTVKAQAKQIKALQND
jgi:hypothetical protein